MKRYLIALLAAGVICAHTAIWSSWIVGTRGDDELEALVRTNSVFFGPFGTTRDILDRMTVGTNAQEYLDAARTFKVITNLVDLIAASGEWCNVKGHDWRDIAGSVSDRWNQICVICWQRRSKPVPAIIIGPGLTNIWWTNQNMIPLAQ